MQRSQKVIMGIIILAVIAFGIDIYLHPVKFAPYPIRKQLINLTGAISFLMMGLIMLLSIRPKWLEGYFGGLDKMYYLHKWAGIWAITFAGLHYVIKIGKPILQYFVAQGPKMKGQSVALSGIEGFLDNYRGLAKDLGEYFVYFLLIMLVITLWQKFSYKIWRYLHKLMAPVFLVLAFHAVVLTPFNYWSEPLGWFIALSVIVGSVCAVIALFGLIGYHRNIKGKVIEVKHYDDLIEITCELAQPFTYTAGQYAFFKHDRLEGAHPFTISSSDHGDNRVRFSIKALGDYTQSIQQAINVGDVIEVEGPYGLFNHAHSTAEHQIWIAGGIGVTPFIAWLEAMVKNQQQAASAGARAQMPQVDFYYCVCNEQEAVYGPYLQQLCDQLLNVTLHCHYSDTDGFLTANQLTLQQDDAGNVSDIWFCGPNPFAKQLQKDLKAQQRSVNPIFHQEIFQMR